MQRTIWAILGVLLLATLILVGCAPGDPSTVVPTAAPEVLGPAEPTPVPAEPAAPSQNLEPIVQGTQAPDFTLVDLDGVERSLSDYRGQVVMLNFWASWCGFCRSEIPHMNTVYTELADQGFEIVAVNLGEDPDHLRTFAVEYEMEFPILTDVEGETVPLYMIRSIPASYFLDAEGVVQVIYGGAIPEETLRTIVQSLLSQ
jgi:thiol-disulfide isomerase/thioredoxin